MTDLLAIRAESLYEEIGGDLCSCQNVDCPHWCEKCQQRIAYILSVFSRLLADGERAQFPNGDFVMHVARPDCDKVEPHIIDSCGAFDPKEFVEPRRAEKPLCATCGHPWRTHARPGDIYADVNHGEEWCYQGDCRCRNYAESK